MMTHSLGSLLQLKPSTNQLERLANEIPLDFL
jgi:hypothetical protein